MKIIKMKRKEFIEKHALPREDDETYRAYKEGRLDYDDDYLLEGAKNLGIIIIDIEE